MATATQKLLQLFKQYIENGSYDEHFTSDQLIIITQYPNVHFKHYIVNVTNTERAEKSIKSNVSSFHFIMCFSSIFNNKLRLKSYRCVPKI